MATSSAAIPPTRRGKSGHFTVHSTAAKSCISNKRPAALDNVRLPALVSRLLFDRITHWPRSSPKSEGRDVPESPPSRRLSMNRPALSSVIAFAVVLGLAVTAQAQSGWPVYGGDPGNTRYSTLTQINPGNVKNLKVAWVLQLVSILSHASTATVLSDTVSERYFTRSSHLSAAA